MSRAVGFYGKLPARGDFVRAGLPRSFVDPWDDWWQRGIAATRAAMADWTNAWLEAPVWRFCLPAGCCGPDKVLGLWLPSVDRANRYFPLTLAVVGETAAPAGFLDAAELAGRNALAFDTVPQVLADSLAAAVMGDAADDPPGPGWWTSGGPRVPATVLPSATLPRFATLIDASWDALL